MTRIYLPTTLNRLAVAAQSGTLEPAGTGAHAVTGAVREWYVQGEEEELEFSALLDAAEAALALLALDPQAPMRRVVLALDVPAEVVSPAPGYRSSVLVAAPIALADVVSLHVDEVGAARTVAAAVAALPAARDGDADARFLVDEAEACDLLWYDISEIDDLIEDLVGG